MKIPRVFNRILQFIRFVSNHFVADDCIYRASALAFTSLLALVPLMSVAFAVLAAFPMFEHADTAIENFVFENFVPAAGKVIQNYLQTFAAQATKVSIWGMLFLIVTAVLMMYTIEKAMNVIWKVKVSRRGIVTFLLYWGILSITPLLIGLSVAISSYLISLPFLSGAAVTFGLNKGWLLAWTPYLLITALFTLLYVAVPNCKVKLWHGLVGAIFASSLFEFAKYLFKLYFKQFHTYELVYGVFASVPIFFLWVFWVWVIILLGAEVSYAFSKEHKVTTNQINP